MSNNIFVRYDNKIENETIIGLSSKKPYGKSLGVVEWVTNHERLNEYEEVLQLPREAHQDIVMIGKYSLYLFVWTMRLNQNDRINSYLLKKEKSLTKMVHGENELYRTNRNTNDTHSANGNGDLQGFYCPSEETLIRWGYIPLSNDRNCLSMCAPTLLSLPRNSFVVAAEGELPESIWTDEVLYSIRHPVSEKVVFCPDNWIYETMTPQIYFNNRIVPIISSGYVETSL